jgi:putative ABC transport system permease protein
MKAPALAWRSLVRQPARSVLGIVGIAAVGALLFDMLLLSSGLVVSFRDLLDEIGFDVRVLATDSLPLAGPRIADARATTATLATLPEIDQVAPMRVSLAEVSAPDGEAIELTFIGIDADARNSWRLVDGSPLPESEDGWIVINRNLAGILALSPGDRLRVRGRCWSQPTATPPFDYRVAGIVDFAFDTRFETTVAVGLGDFLATCGEQDNDSVDMLLVASADGVSPEDSVAAIRRLRPDLHAFSNQQLVNRFHANDFSYFRQMSFVLASVTLFFSFLLITSLLTVSVNQRFAEVAALRALGFTRARIVTDLLIQSALLVGSGGLLALPLGGALAVWLDTILKAMPHVPVNLHFFVFQTRAIVLHVALLGGVGVAAALYPVYLAVRLPIAATLRDEVVS